MKMSEEAQSNTMHLHLVRWKETDQTLFFQSFVLHEVKSASSSVNGVHTTSPFLRLHRQGHTYKTVCCGALRSLWLFPRLLVRFYYFYEPAPTRMAHTTLAPGPSARRRMPFALLFDKNLQLQQLLSVAAIAVVFLFASPHSKRWSVTQALNTKTVHKPTLLK